MTDITAGSAVTGVGMTVVTVTEAGTTVVTATGTAGVMMDAVIETITMMTDVVTGIIAVTEIFALIRQCITIENADVKETAITIKTGVVNAAVTTAMTAGKTETGINNKQKMVCSKQHAFFI